MTEVNSIKTAVSNFRDKYNAYPGDMSNATSYWGAAAGCVDTPTLTTTATCNGNGDDRVGTAYTTREQVYLWHHLSNAQMLTFTLTNIGETNSATATYAAGLTRFIPGFNFPASKWANSGFSFLFVEPNYNPAYGWGNSYFPPKFNGHLIWFGSGGGHAPYYSLTRLEAHHLDLKFDDGKPAAGSIIAQAQDSCATGGVFTNVYGDATPQYWSSGVTGQKGCHLGFVYAH